MCATVNLLPPNANCEVVGTSGRRNTRNKNEVDSGMKLNLESGAHDTDGKCVAMGWRRGVWWCERLRISTLLFELPNLTHPERDTNAQCMSELH